MEQSCLTCYHFKWGKPKTQIPSKLWKKIGYGKTSLHINQSLYCCPEIKMRLHKWFRPIMKRVLQLFGAFPSHYFDSYLFCRSDGRWYFLLFKRKFVTLYLTAKFLFTILLQFFAGWKEIGHEIIILFSLSDCILEIIISN